MGQFWTILGLLWFMQNGSTLLTTNAFTGSLTSGSNVVTGISSFAGLAVGQFVVGLGIPAGTTILAMNPTGGTITLSANATLTTPSGQVSDLWSYGTVGQSIPIYVHLLTGTVPTGPDLVWAQLTEANYDGYTPQQFGPPFVYNTPDGNTGVISGVCLTWQPTDYNVPANITGIAFTYTTPGASGPSLLAVEPLKAQVALTSPGDIMRIIPCLSLPTDALGLSPSPLLA